MISVYVEPRPKARDEHARIDNYVVETEGDKVLATFPTQEEAIGWAKRNNYIPHVARVRHLLNKRNPDHFRKA
jgi:class 3 adenylate cyclase